MNPLAQFDVVAGIIAVVALILLFVGYKLLASTSWILGWLLGNLGIAFLVSTVLVAMSIVDIRTYKPMFDDRTLVTMTFRKTPTGVFDALMVDDRGNQQHFQLSGDSSAIAMNIYKWSIRFHGMGLKHGYRFVALNTKQSAADQPHDLQEITLSTSRYVDVWKFFNKHMPESLFVVAQSAQTPDLKMVDGAIYEVIPSGLLLQAKPVNEIARQAMPVVDATPPAATPAVAQPAQATAPAAPAVAAPPTPASPTTAPAAP